jgi:hypothetical protein
MFSTRLYSLSFALATVVMFFTDVSLAQVDTYRPDLIWAVGSNQTTINCFGMNQIRFDRGMVEVVDLDSIGIQEFDVSNVQFVTPNFSLYGDAYQLTNGYSDSILSHLSFDTWSFRRDEGPNFGVGFQAILPLGEEKIVYLSDVFYEPTTSVPYIFFTPGFVVSYLSVDSLTTSVNQTNSVEKTFLVLANDTLVNRVVEHNANPAGGWYGISRSAVSNKLALWQIDPDTTYLLTPHEVDDIGIFREGSILDITFRPNGDAFAISGSYSGLELYYFDRNTGVISLWENLGTSYDPDFEPFTAATRSEWSADGRYLYLTTEANLYQFDTESSDIAASAVQINDPASIPFSGSYYQIERGPDCRLYIARSGTGKTLSVIDKPSRPGRACDLKDSGLLLPNFYFVSIPEFPEYSLWAKDRVARGLAPIIDTAVCDSSIAAYDYFDFTSSTTDVIVEAENLQISPNPASSGTPLRLTYTLPTSLKTEVQKPLQARLFSMSGQQVGNLEIISIDSQEARVQLPEGMPTGMYRLLVSSSTTPIFEGKVVVR